MRRSIRPCASKFAVFPLGVVALIGLWCGIAAAARHREPVVPSTGSRRRHPDVPGAERVDDGQRGRTAHPVPAGPPDRGTSTPKPDRDGRSRCTRPCSPSPSPPTTGRSRSTVSEIDWSGGSIPVGQFGEFNVLAQGLPTGTLLLTFKAVQLYSDGTTVNWIQIPTKAAPDPAHPAPTLVLVAPDNGSSGTSRTSAAASSAASPIRRPAGARVSTMDWPWPPSSWRDGHRGLGLGGVAWPAARDDIGTASRARLTRAMWMRHLAGRTVHLPWPGRPFSSRRTGCSRCPGGTGMPSRRTCSG